MIFTLPDGEIFDLNTILIDLNGTLTVHAEIPSEVPKLIKRLKEANYQIYLLSGDARGTAKDIAETLGIELTITKNSTEKESAILKLSPKNCVAIGNARIDIGMFKHAKVSIATLQAEGIHSEIMQHTDIVCPSIENALELLLDEKTFVATMRK